MPNTLASPVRRSARLTTHDSNGRDYLANTLSWSRRHLESWMTSKTVRPLLHDWFHLCVEGKHRYNEAIEWINTGENGYFYNPCDVEENILFECLADGDGDFAAECPPTGHWLTQKLWARAAWRIAQANAEALALATHSARAYAFVIDLLCIVFHSIAYRGKGSVYYGLIVGFTHAAEVKWAKERVLWLKRHGDEDAVAEREADEESEIVVQTRQAPEGSNIVVHARQAVNLDMKEVPEKGAGMGVEVEGEAVQDIGFGGKTKAVEKWIECVNAYTDDDFEEGTESESGASEFVG